MTLSVEHKLATTGVVLTRRSLCSVCMVGWKERAAWIGCLGGRVNSECNNFDDSKAMADCTWSASENNFKSSLCCLISFALSNCLNLSCNRAIEEWMMAGSQLCLPIEGQLVIFWWESAVVRSWEFSNPIYRACVCVCFKIMMHLTWAFKRDSYWRKRSSSVGSWATKSNKTVLCGYPKKSGLVELKGGKSSSRGERAGKKNPNDDGW